MPIYIIKGGGTLTSYRVVTDTPTITADWATQGQVKFNAGSSIASFAATKNGTDQIIADATFTKVTFTTATYDTGGFYDAANSKWTPPAGKIHISLSLRHEATNAISSFACIASVYKNGVEFKTVTVGGVAAASYVTTSVSLDDAANGTDYYEAFALQDATTTGTIGGATVNSYFSGHMI